MNRLEKFGLTIAMLTAAAPALAGGPAVPVPAPAIGVGIGAVMLIGFGYRALKRRINR